jgi:lambda repressor-like predicted transcriptional regulator
MHREEIKAQLRMRFGSLRKFEIIKGLARNSASFVLQGRGILPAAEAIANELGIPLHRVSSFYHDQFCRLANVPRHKAKPRNTHRINAEVR